MSKETLAYLEYQTAKKWHAREEQGALRYETSGFTTEEAELFLLKLRGFRIDGKKREEKKNPTVSLDEAAVQDMQRTYVGSANVNGLTMAEEMGLSRGQSR